MFKQESDRIGVAFKSAFSGWQEESTGGKLGQKQKSQVEQPRTAISKLIWLHNSVSERKKLTQQLIIISDMYSQVLSKSEIEEVLVAAIRTKKKRRNERHKNWKT